MTRRLVYSMTASLDGYIAGPGGDIGWSAPDEELHRFHNNEVSELGAHLLGRRLYETMLYWETPEPDHSDSEVTAEFAQIWRALPKVVFSSTLDRVEGKAMLARDGLAEVVARLKAQPGKDIGVGGATLAAACTELGLIDEYRVFLSPVAIGGGTPYLPVASGPVHLELVESRTLRDRVVYLRYRRA